MKYSIKKLTVTQAKDNDDFNSKLIEFGAEGELIKEFATLDEAVAFFKRNYTGENISPENRATVTETAGKLKDYEFFAVIKTAETEDESDEEYGLGTLMIWEHDNGNKDFIFFDNLD